MVGLFVSVYKMKDCKVVNVVINLLNIYPEKKIFEVKKFILPEKITSKNVNSLVVKGIAHNWKEVGDYIKFGINKESKAKCPLTIVQNL